MIVVDPSADRLEELEERYPDPRVTWLIGDGVVIPIPDDSVDKVLGEGSEAELRRVLRRVKRAVVLGTARSGQAAAALLERNGVEVVLAGRDLDNDGDLSLLDDADVLVKSPGVPRDNPLVAAARIPIWSEVELAYRLLPNPILGVTGTNGKTTTTEWLGAMFRAAGRDVAVAGNVGRALSARGGAGARRGSSASSRASSSRTSTTSVLASQCWSTSSRITSTGTARSRPTATRSCASSRTSTRRTRRCVPRGFGRVPGSAARVEFDADDPLPAEPGLPGRHNRENAAAATAAARAAGIPDEAIAEALQTFPGVPHRLELVAEIGRRALRQRLEGDEHHRGPARARRRTTSLCT